MTVLEQPDPHRATLAGALHAVAVFHHRGHEQGRQQLEALLHEASVGSPITAMLQADATAMRMTDQGGAALVAAVPPPVPGGVLHPDTASPDPTYLADLIYRAGAVRSANTDPRPPHDHENGTS